MWGIFIFAAALGGLVAASRRRSPELEPPYDPATLDPDLGSGPTPPPAPPGSGSTARTGAALTVRDRRRLETLLSVALDRRRRPQATRRR
jgi:hypothetical protein